MRCSTDLVGRSAKSKTTSSGDRAGIGGAAKDRGYRLEEGLHTKLSFLRTSDSSRIIGRSPMI
jgi:hypothetical protein